MIHHVSIEATAGELDMCVHFYSILGFEEVVPPGELADRGRWLEAEGSQVHVLEADRPQISDSTHFAVVVEDFEDVFDRLEAMHFEPERRSEYWGSPRALVHDPAGNLVEFMEFAP